MFARIWVAVRVQKRFRSMQTRCLTTDNEMSVCTCLDYVLYMVRITLLAPT